jgi:hypothetical protein
MTRNHSILKRAARLPGLVALVLEEIVRRRLLATLLVSCPALAQAAEGESGVSASVGYGHYAVSQDDETLDARGGVVGVDYAYGISDSFWLRGSLSGGLYDGPEGTANSGVATFGLTYQFDLLRYVPWISLGAGAAVVGGGGIDGQILPLVGASLGLEVLESRAFSWGAAATFDTYGADLLYFTIGPRVTWRWGYF